MRRGSIVALVAAVVLLASASLAWAVGELTQKSGPAGCFAKVGSKSPCQQAIGFDEGTPALAISPDGRSVYVGSLERSNGGLEVFDRDPATGALTQKPGKSGCLSREGGECEVASDFEDPNAAAVSPDGKNVYVVSQGGMAGGLVVFDRDQSGALVQKAGAAGCFDESGRGGCTKVSALNTGAAGVTVSPDGKNVYVASREADGIVVLDRDSEGGLTQKAGPAGCIAMSTVEGCTQGRALGKPEQIVVTPDGSEVLVVSQGAADRGFEGGIAIFDRDPSTGALTQKQGPAGCVTEAGSAGACQASPDAQSANAIALSGDGDTLYVAGGRGLGIFDRQSGGLWAQKQGPAGCVSTSASGGCQAAAGMGFPDGVAVSPDDASVYTTSRVGVAIFDRARPLVSPPPDTTPPDTTPPTVSGFKLSLRRFRAAPRGKGSRFGFALSEPADVAIEIQRVVRGRRVGKTCLPARKPKATGARPCTRSVTVGRLTDASLGAGAGLIAFSGKVGKRVLRPGSYRATIVATDAAGNRSASLSTAFTVLPASAR